MPPALGAVVHRLLAKRPGDRYQAVGELAAVLAALPPPVDSQPNCRPVAASSPPDSPTTEPGAQTLD